MEEMKLRTIAELMQKQSGEEVEFRAITMLPDNNGTDNMSVDRYDAYVARTANYTCLVHLYKDGRVHVYVH